MSDKTTKVMLDALKQVAMPTLFLAGKFSSPARNFYNSQEVEIDIVRGDRAIAPVITDLSSGGHLNKNDLFTNKGFVAPVFKEIGTLNGFDMINRVAGKNPFEDVNFQSNAMVKAVDILRICSDKIKRATELQAAQVLQTGIVTLKDETGADAYSIDYKPKTSHFPTAGTVWANASATPLLDLESLCDKVNDDSFLDADQALFGKNSWNDFIRNSSVQALLDNRRMILGGIAPEAPNGQGGKFMGVIEVGSYRLEMWTYNGKYDVIGGAASTRYLAADKVVVRASSARMDATFGSIPQIVAPESRVMPFLPSNIRNSQMNMGMSLNAWADAQGENVFIQAGSRPLLIPTQIDSFGCLTTA